MPRKTRRRGRPYDGDAPFDPDEAERLLSLGAQAALRGDWENADRAIAFGERLLRAAKRLREIDPNAFAWKSVRLDGDDRDA